MQRGNTWRLAERVAIPRPAGRVQCHESPATRDPSRAANHEGFS